MTHESTDLIVALSAGIGAFAAIVTPIIFRLDVKRSMAESWGKLTERVDSNVERIDKVETDVKEHESRISYMEGKANGHAAGRPF